ncbi:phosphonate C-P lyase system protein PhnH [Paenibacillus sp. MBLB4367]|uniref:phosphonate C-P lyase system protein PhnH n=1 Tax=Paenibacillus sp. MBLB4367 TaxID=3384767 RepID=UPI0039080E2D
MKLDLVHDIQTSYRKVVDAMSRPGVIADLAEEAGKLGKDAGCFPSTLLIAMMLLDTEVSFKVISAKEAEVTHLFNQLTYARAAEAEQADYVFVLQDAASDDLRSALEGAKIGDLLDPHHSATVVVESESLTGTGEDALRLTGPGIEDACFAQVNMQADWVEIRAERNAEYPLGIDLLFVDTDHRLLCLPRTTQVSKGEVK